MDSVVPGEVILAKAPIEQRITEGTVELDVDNTCDRAIQVTSHFHFFEVNRYLRFHRAQAYGMRLDVPANLAVRFEPGESRRIRLRPVAGARLMYGFHNLVDGELDSESVREVAFRRARERGFVT